MIAVLLFINAATAQFDLKGESTNYDQFVLKVLI